MSKLFDDASLAMIPSAYKDGKLYSIRPTDGSGDFTFSRGSNLAATRVDVNGLIEKGRENILLQSNQFDTTWQTASATPISGYADRNGGTNAWLLREFASSSPHWIRQSSGLYSGIGTFSFYAKKKDYDWIQFGRSGDGGDFANFNISNGTLGNVSGSGIIDRKIESVGNEWYRCSVTYSFGSNSFVGIAIIRSDVSTRYEAYLGDGTSGTYIQDAQVELGLVATDYIKTTTTSVSAGILEDMPRLDYSGGASCPSLLLEPQRSNLITQSEYFDASYWAKFDTSVSSGFTSPDGLTNASKLIASVSNTNHRIRSSVMTTPAVGTVVTFSIYCKPQEITKIALVDNWTNLTYSVVNLSTNSVIEEAFYSGTGSTAITEMANGFKRISFTYQSSNISTFPAVYLLDDGYTSGNPTSYTFSSDGTSGVLIYGAQFEIASYPTSYIPTYGTSQTRSGDSCLATSVSDLIGQEQGTLFIEFDHRAMTSYPNEYIIDIQGGSNKLWIRKESGGGNLTSRLIVNGTNIWTISINATDGATKIALSYDSGNSAVYHNGTQVGTSSSTFSGNSFSDIYFSIAGSAIPELKAKQLVLFKTRLTNTELASLTTL